MKQYAILLLLIGSCIAVAYLWDTPPTHKVTGLSLKEPLVLDIELLPKEKDIQASDKILFGIVIINLGDSREKDIQLSIFLRGEDGTNILLQSETLAIQTRASTTGELRVPDNLKERSYEVYAEARDIKTGELLGSESERIFVVQGIEVKISTGSVKYLIAIGVILVILAFIALRARFHKHKEINKEREEMQ